ncbi:unnamed protein product [Notodromas monacha]|uniref:Uncharacterized protein n=1 Tax=Notodromas monacha TaxID=399045 RepID=A0A7R9BQB8_9CRUS|nr:unnamed protein product [Notodromas monacha]CAG0919710.1 unnamed protein product [Notodromas monacha]
MFKKPGKRRNLRSKDDDESPSVDGEASGDEVDKVLEVKERQKLREKPRGIDVGDLNAGLKLYPDPQEVKVVDPFKTLTGGLVDRNTLRKRCDQSDDAYDTGIGTSFSAETNLRDEDDEMRRFIDAELAKRTGKVAADEEAKAKQQEEKFLSPEDAALQAIPDELKSSHKSWSEKNEEMLSSQMLSGIPEVDLGMEAKIKNIEATESAKNRILAERMKKKELPSEFVPTNMAVNFVQHNRYNIDDGSNRRGRGRGGSHHHHHHQAREESTIFGKPREIVKKRAPEPKVVVGLDGEATLVTEARAARKPGEERATDDFAYEKFKKQFKKH